MPTVLITGSSRGIGFGIARQFAKKGYSIVLNGREDKERLADAVKALRDSFDCNVMGIRMDVSDYLNAEDLFWEVEEKFGTVDVLVNNAGAAHFGLFSDMEFEEVDKVLADNLNTAIYMSKLVIPGMVRAKKGSIINISSIWGVTGASCEVVYSAAKAGVIGFTKALAKELAPSGVRVNAIACGAFDTRMNDRLTEAERKAFTNEIPLGRFGKPDEVGDLAVFLASDKAAYLTGQTIALDGGIT